MKVAALAGGVGGAKLLVGLDRALGGRGLTAVVNTGDDADVYGVRVSPDVDIVTYWLAGLADRERGWGIRGDTFTVVGALRAFGPETWFMLGDRDLATCIYRTQRLVTGATLTEVTAEVSEALGVRAEILPMSDEDVRTFVSTADGRRLAFQEYFVRDRCAPEVVDVHFAGAAAARPGPRVLRAIAAADRVVVCPSNPILSIGPITSVPGVRDALRAHPHVVAVTPIVRGRALKGPADRILASLGHHPTASGVARLYADFCDAFVVDGADAAEAARVEAAGTSATVLDTVMTDDTAAARLAEEVLAL